MRAIVVGTGAGGALVARELTRKGFQVVILEAGGRFAPLTRKVTLTEPLRRAGALGSERTIGRLFPSMWVQRSSEDLVLIRGIAEGGTTTIACGNLLRATRGLDEIGLDLAPEFERLEAELHPTTVPRERWRPLTGAMFDVAERMGLNPAPTPKGLELTRCASCGLCEVGCPTGAKWDSRRWVAEARAAGATIRLNSSVGKVVIENGQARGVQFSGANGLETITADVVVLCAGAIGTAQILRASSLPVEDRLWADIVMTVGGQKDDAEMLHEVPMIWYTKHDRYILSPYIDILSHWFHKPWRNIGLKDRVGLMIKLAEEENGTVEPDGTVHKSLSCSDRDRLEGARQIAEKVMTDAGVEGPFVPGMLNAGHLGGTVPLTREDLGGMRPAVLPRGLYVADLSLLPRSQGMPTMLTTGALALRVADRIAEA
ncbi:MAG TPA: GMC family oxidoreductase N-terminal domain-containing protein [Methanomassiliicoccales archaeon]|nr:GMC family oxidoreductase N-terminal domain-containing protein [Methanomassiliicoccales archaeon]